MAFKTKRDQTLTLNLSKAEMEALAALADRQGMSKSAVLRQAIRLYQREVLGFVESESVGCMGDPVDD